MQDVAEARHLFETAWERHGELPPDSGVRWQAQAAGVWLVVLHSLPDQPDAAGLRLTVADAVDPDELSPTAAALYRLSFTDEQPPTPRQLQQQLVTGIDRVTDLEIQAYQTLPSLQ